MRARYRPLPPVAQRQERGREFDRRDTRNRAVVDIGLDCTIAAAHRPRTSRCGHSNPNLKHRLWVGRPASMPPVAATRLAHARDLRTIEAVLQPNCSGAASGLDPSRPIVPK